MSKDYLSDSYSFNKSYQVKIAKKVDIMDFCVVSTNKILPKHVHMRKPFLTFLFLLYF